MTNLIHLEEILLNKNKKKLQNTQGILTNKNFKPKSSKFTCDGFYDQYGRIYRGRCKKEEVFIELNYLKSINICDIKLYKAYDLNGMVVPTHFAIFGKDK